MSCPGCRAGSVVAGFQAGTDSVSGIRPSAGKHLLPSATRTTRAAVVREYWIRIIRRLRHIRTAIPWLFCFHGIGMSHTAGHSLAAQPERVPGRYVTSLRVIPETGDRNVPGLAEVNRLINCSDIIIVDGPVTGRRSEHTYVRG
jgi:hypothetical protein